MKNFARIENGKVVERLDADELPPFHPSLHWEQCPAATQVGWLFDGSQFLAPVVDVTAAKTGKWSAIKAERDRRIQSGGYKVGTKWFHSDTFSRTQQMGLVMLGANIPANTPWKTMDGTTVTMTQALAGQIFATAAASDIAIFAAAEAHKAAMEASANPSAYDFATGWPKVFWD